MSIEKFFAFTAFAVFGIVTGLIIIARAKRKTIDSVQYFGVSTLLLGLFSLLLTVRDLTGDPIVVPVIGEILFYAGWIVLAIYVQQTFIKGTKRRNPLKVVLTVLSVLAVASMLFTIVACNASDTHTYDYYNFWRFLIDNGFISQIAMLWCVVECFIAYGRLDDRDRPFVGKKYLLFSTGFIAVSVGSLINFLGTYFVPVLTGLFTIVLAIGSLINMVLTYLVWIAPGLLGRILHVSFSSERLSTVVGETQEAPAAGLPDEFYTAALRSTSLMSVINHLGSLLSRRINKTVGACNGFLLMTLSSVLGDDATYKLTLAQLQLTFKDNLSRRLRLVGIEDADPITAELVGEFTSNKAFMTMAIF